MSKSYGKAEMWVRGAPPRADTGPRAAITLEAENDDEEALLAAIDRVARNSGGMAFRIGPSRPAREKERHQSSSEGDLPDDPSDQ